MLIQFFNFKQKQNMILTWENINKIKIKIKINNLKKKNI